jgi:hypothetical protein
MELNQMQQAGVIEKIQDDISEYASPIVVVSKRSTDAIRICGDFKVSVNRALRTEHYPLPRTEDLFAKLGRCKYFTKLDLSEAYHQIRIDTNAQKLLVINTPKGLYRFLRMPFGIGPAPAKFQRIMDKLLSGISGVVCSLDDVLIASESLDIHLETLRQVFKRFLDAGVRLSLTKCILLSKSVQYLGHMVDEDGLHTAPSTTKAIINAPEPSNAGQLRAFLGLVNYYGKFVNDLSTVCSPLYQLLRKDTSWQWNDEQRTAFKTLKRILSSPPILCHYEPSLPIGLAADASSYGVGVSLFHTFPDGSERPIAYASKTLNSSQRIYAQIEKEAYGIIFGVSKFKQYLYGRRFTLVTDHKPLVALFGPDKPIPDRASARNFLQFCSY